MSFLSDLLFGTEREAQRLNEGNVERGLGLLGNVDVSGLFGRARGQITDQGRQDLLGQYQSAISQLGAAGTGAQLEATRAADVAGASTRQNLAQRGLFSSSLAQSGDRGISADLTRMQSNIASGTAVGQGGLMAGLGGALAQESRSREGALAGLNVGQAGMELGRAGQQAGLLGNVQYQGTPGALGGLLSSVGLGLQGAQEGGASGGVAAGLGACCFIMAEDYGSMDAIPPSVRRYRDEEAGPLARSGYIRMAKWLVPLMRDHKTVMWLVRRLMTRPLARYAEWFYGCSKVGWLFAPAKWWWLAVWEIMAQVEREEPV